MTISKHFFSQNRSQDTLLEAELKQSTLDRITKKIKNLTTAGALAVALFSTPDLHAQVKPITIGNKKIDSNISSLSVQDRSFFEYYSELVQAYYDDPQSLTEQQKKDYYAFEELMRAQHYTVQATLEAELSSHLVREQLGQEKGEVDRDLYEEYVTMMESMPHIHKDLSVYPDSKTRVKSKGELINRRLISLLPTIQNPQQLQQYARLVGKSLLDGEYTKIFDHQWHIVSLEWQYLAQYQKLHNKTLTREQEKIFFQDLKVEAYKDLITQFGNQVDKYLNPAVRDPELVEDLKQDIIDQSLYLARLIYHGRNLVYLDAKYGFIEDGNTYQPTLHHYEKQAIQQYIDQVDDNNGKFYHQGEQPHQHIHAIGGYKSYLLHQLTALISKNTDQTKQLRGEAGVFIKQMIANLKEDNILNQKIATHTLYHNFRYGDFDDMDALTVLKNDQEREAINEPVEASWLRALASRDKTLVFDNLYEIEPEALNLLLSRHDAGLYINLNHIAKNPHADLPWLVRVLWKYQGPLTIKLDNLYYRDSNWLLVSLLSDMFKDNTIYRTRRAPIHLITNNFRGQDFQFLAYNHGPVTLTAKYTDIPLLNAQGKEQALREFKVFLRQHSLKDAQFWLTLNGGISHQMKDIYMPDLTRLNGHFETEDPEFSSIDLGYFAKSQFKHGLGLYSLDPTTKDDVEKQQYFDHISKLNNAFLWLGIVDLATLDVSSLQKLKKSRIAYLKFASTECTDPSVLSTLVTDEVVNDKIVAPGYRGVIEFTLPLEQKTLIQIVKGLSVDNQKAQAVAFLKEVDLTNIDCSKLVRVMPSIVFHRVDWVNLKALQSLLQGDRHPNSMIVIGEMDWESIPVAERTQAADLIVESVVKKRLTISDQFVNQMANALLPKDTYDQSQLSSKKYTKKLSSWKKSLDEYYKHQLAIVRDLAKYDPKLPGILILDPRTVTTEMYLKQ